jgi:hypothetical protein
MHLNTGRPSMTVFEGKTFTSTARTDWELRIPMFTTANVSLTGQLE